MICKHCDKSYNTNGWLLQHEQSCSSKNKSNIDQQRPNLEEVNIEIYHFPDELFDSYNNRL